MNLQLPEIAEYWSYWSAPPEGSIPRDISLPKRLSPELALVIQGVRRSGKSTLLTQLIGHYKLERKNCLFINFEDPRLVGFLNHHTLDEIVTYFRSIRPKANKLYFFFDEVQNVEHWQKWLHTQLERPKNNYFIVTGSNASLLSRELGTSLTGRHTSLTLYPFSFQERSSQKQCSLENYLKTGGFPATMKSSDPDELLRQYFNDIVEKDIIARTGLSNSRSLKQLIRMIFESCGSELSLRKLAGSTSLAVDTVGSYLDYAEAAYLILSCPFFSFSEKQRIRRNKKYYAIDSALRRSIATPTGKDIGKDFELIVFLELKRRYGEVFYWKDNREVDFIVQSRDGFFPVQVSASEPQERHYKALEEFYAKFPQASSELYINMANYSEYFS